MLNESCGCIFQFENPRATLPMNTIIDQQPTSVCARVLTQAGSGLDFISLRVNAFTHRWQKARRQPRGSKEIATDETKMA